MKLRSELKGQSHESFFSSWQYILVVVGGGVPPPNLTAVKNMQNPRSLIKGAVSRVLLLADIMHWVWCWVGGGDKPTFPGMMGEGGGTLSPLLPLSPGGGVPPPQPHHCYFCINLQKTIDMYISQLLQTAEITVNSLNKYHL